MTNCERCKSERVAHATDGNTVPFIVLEAEREHHRREKRNIVVAFLVVLLALVGYITFDRYQDACSICSGQSVDQQACDGLFVASKISEGVRREIDFAKSHGIEVAYVEN